MQFLITIGQSKCYLELAVAEAVSQSISFWKKPNFPKYAMTIYQHEKVNM